MRSRFAGSIVDAGAITDIDYSAARSVLGLLDDLDRKGVSVIFARVSSYLLSDFERHGIAAAVGKTRIFASLHEAIAAARNCTPLAGATELGSASRQDGPA